MHTNIPEMVLNAGSGSVSLGWHLRVCVLASSQMMPLFLAWGHFEHEALGYL